MVFTNVQKAFMVESYFPNGQKIDGQFKIVWRNFEMNFLISILIRMLFCIYSKEEEQVVWDDKRVVRDE